MPDWRSCLLDWRSRHRSLIREKGEVFLCPSAIRRLDLVAGGTVVVVVVVVAAAAAVAPVVAAAAYAAGAAAGDDA